MVDRYIIKPAYQVYEQETGRAVRVAETQEEAEKMAEDLEKSNELYQLAKSAGIPINSSRDEGIIQEMGEKKKALQALIDAIP